VHQHNDGKSPHHAGTSIATVTLHVAAFGELSAATLYDLLSLRMRVFIVEQRCPYQDLDGRDTEPGTRHVWRTEDGSPAAYLRILAEPDGTDRIGRVCVAPDARGTGLARRLMLDALELTGPHPVVLDAQSYLAGFYERLGFTASGPEFVEDGIRHTPMRLTAAPRPVPRPNGADR
jgi:ElaA protein